MLRQIVSIIALSLTGLGLYAALPSHCPKEEGEVQGILEMANAQKTSKWQRAAAIAESLVGRPADYYYMTDSIATLRVNVDSFTPMSFINSVLALADVAEGNSATPVDFERRLIEISCRRGENGGYPSLMYYSSDWIVDNIYRGNLRELTEDYDGARSKMKSLDWQSRNKDKIAAMSNPDIAEKVKMTEMGFRSHRLPMLPKSAVSRKDVAEDLRDGDILVLLASADGEDTFRIGIVKNDADGAHLIYFDPSKGEVVKETETLKRYFNLVTKHFSGFRWLRMK